jgi:hypothetical protein
VRSFETTSVIRRWVSVAAAVGAMGAAERADAQTEDPKSACLRAHEEGQIARKESRFADAREELRSCAQEQCPGLVRADCVEWLSQLEMLYPSVVFDAYVDGRQALGAEVYADGRLASDHIDGRAMEMDPGRHVFRIEVPGFPPSEQILVLPEGARRRMVSASFEHPPPPAKAYHRPIPATVWIALEVAVAGAASMGVFGGLALSEKSSLGKSCGPLCSDHQLTTLRAYMGGANVSLGVAVAAVFGGGILFLLRPEVERPAPPSLSVTAATGGGIVSWSGRF